MNSPTLKLGASLATSASPVSGRGLEEAANFLRVRAIRGRVPHDVANAAAHAASQAILDEATALQKVNPKLSLRAALMAVTSPHGVARVPDVSPSAAAVEAIVQRARVSGRVRTEVEAKALRAVARHASPENITSFLVELEKGRKAGR